PGQSHLGLRAQYRFLPLRYRRFIDDAECTETRGGGSEKRGLAAGGIRRIAFCVSGTGHPLDDASRLFRHIFFVRCLALADIRAGYSSSWRARIRVVIRGPLRGRRTGERRDGTALLTDRS